MSGECNNCGKDHVEDGCSQQPEQELKPDLDYYRMVVKTQTSSKILKMELSDLIEEVEAWNQRKGE